MKLRSIRLFETGAFRDAVTIDGFGDGLNVLAGPNEHGKSTILRALTALFRDNHRSTKQALRTLQPYGGGAPHVSCEFELDGKSWRLSKQFLAGHAAELVRLDASERFRGADAENRLSELLGGGGGLLDSLPLVWAEQDAVSQLPVLDEALRSTLGDLLAREVQSASGAGASGQVLHRLEAELAGMVTLKTGKPAKGGAYYAALQRLSEQERELAELRGRADESGARLKELSRLQDEEAALADESEAQAREGAVRALDARLAEAVEARRRVEQARERLKLLERERANAAGQLASHDALLRERAILVSEQEAAKARLALVRQDVDRSNASLLETNSRCAELAEKKTVLAGELETCRQAHAVAEARSRRDGIASRIAAFDALSEKIGACSAALGEMNWPDDGIAVLRRLQREIDDLTVRQLAASPRVSVSYIEGGGGRFEIAGRHLNDGEEFSVVTPQRIVVPGVGAIEVSPADAVDATERAARLDALRRDLAVGLSTFGVETVDLAEVRERERDEQRRELAVLIARRDAGAPDGRDKMAAELSDVAEWLTANEAGIREDFNADARRLEAEQEIAEVDRRLAIVQAEADRLKTVITDLERDAVAETAAIEARDGRRAQIESELPPSGERAARRDDLMSAVAAAEQTVHEAARELRAWEEKALDAAAMTVLEADVARARKELVERVDRLGQVRQDLRRIEGMLSRDFEEGAAAEAEEMAARLDATKAHVASLEAHIAALQLLRSELEGARARHRLTVAQPLSERLGDLARRLWPDVSFDLDADMTVGGLVRAGCCEAPLAVSTGTREQVGVLARLAYAGLLADNGQTLPVILDDPLPSTDDARLDQLFAVFAEAAAAQQIIVLTCHERAFAPLVERFDAQALSVVPGEAEIGGLGRGRAA